MSNSVGISVKGNNGYVPIDAGYLNLVEIVSGSTAVSTGVVTIDMGAGAHHDFVAAIRHIGISVSFVSYLYTTNGVYGVRLFVLGTGTVYWKAYRKHYPLTPTGIGLIVNNASGTQVFNSNHKYLDVSYVSKTDKSTHYLRNNYYLLVLPQAPRISYRVDAFTNSTPIRGYVQKTRIVQKLQPVRTCRQEYVCNWDPFGRRNVCGFEQVCETRNQWVWVTENYSVWEIVGYSFFTSYSIIMAKKIKGFYQSSETLTESLLSVNGEVIVAQGGSVGTSYGGWLSSISGGVYAPVPEGVLPDMNLSNFVNSVIGVQ